MGEDRKPIALEMRVIITVHAGAFPAKVTITNGNGDIADDFFLPKERARDVIGWARIQRALTRS